METNKLTIATMTWARDAEEESLLRSALPILAKLDVNVHITDGGSGEGFLEFLQGFSRFKIWPAKARGVWAQVKNSISHAAEDGEPFILYTEPDKRDFFQSGLAAFIREAETMERTGVITASRSARGFATFPVFQQMTETAINQCCAELTGLKEDYTYGPFIMNSKLEKYLHLVQEDIGWGWRPYVFALAHRAGYTVDAITKDYYCPAEQRDDTPKERLYRMRQLQQNIQGMLLAATVELEQVR